MISVKVELVGTLQKKLDMRKLNVILDRPATIMALIQRLGLNSLSKSSSVIDGEAVNPRSSILILVDGREISALDGLNTILDDGVSVTFIPVSHGG